MSTKAMPPKKVKPCIWPGCDRLARGIKMCITHHRRKKLGLPMDAPFQKRYQKGQTCRLSGCTKPVYCQELCNRHYRRSLVALPDWYAPIRATCRAETTTNVARLHLSRKAQEMFLRACQDRALSTTQLASEIIERWALRQAGYSEDGLRDVPGISAAWKRQSSTFEAH